jgi:hypothetical protein
MCSLLLLVVAPAKALRLGGAGNIGSNGPINTISIGMVPTPTWWSTTGAVPIDSARQSSAAFV